MNRIFFYNNDLNKVLLMTNVAQYIITLEHDFCEKCQEVLDDCDFITEVNFWEVVDEDDWALVSTSVMIDGHGITIREK